jgi:hypothetical protein
MIAAQTTSTAIRNFSTAGSGAPSAGGRVKRHSAKIDDMRSHQGGGNDRSRLKFGIAPIKASAVFTDTSRRTTYYFDYGHR